MRLVSRRGVTVVELLVTCGLFFGLLTLLVAFFVRGQRMAVKTEAVARVQQEASRLSRALAGDLYQSTWKWSQWSNGNLLVLSSRPVNDTDPALEFKPLTGEVMWKKWVAFVLEPSTGVVRRFEIPLSTPTSDLSSAPPPPLTLADLPTLDHSRSTVVGRNILEFSPQAGGSTGTVEFKVKAGTQLELGNLSEEEKKVEVSLTTTIRLGQP